LPPLEASYFPVRMNVLSKYDFDWLDLSLML